MSKEAFRQEVKDWLAENCPPGARGDGQMPTGSTKIPLEDPDTALWLQRMAEKGWTAPTWPTEYGGGGLSTDEAVILLEEMQVIDARAPLLGMGIRMIGPTLLEFGTDDQKQRHLPKIVRGEAAWCQGYSEPGAGSDLASLRTRAEDQGDFFSINGQKTWTSGAQFADWMFALVRTNPDVPKHEGISFVLLDMDQPGITTKPVQLISGSSPFCETFFDNAIAQKSDLVGKINQGWSVGKRLLQYERSGQGGLAGSPRLETGGIRGDLSLMDSIAKQYVGENDQGLIADADFRDEVIRHHMNSHSFKLTQKRVGEENSSGKTLGEATSIFKIFGSSLARTGAELKIRLMGTQGHGWEGGMFSDDELESTRTWLASRSITIYGGTNEVQNNIVAKRVLGLPD